MPLRSTDINPSFPIEEVANYPPPGKIAPSAIAFSPNDRLLTYLFNPDFNLKLLLTLPVQFKNLTNQVNAGVRLSVVAINGGDYHGLLFPDGRHQPRELADRVFMEE